VATDFRLSADASFRCRVSSYTSIEDDGFPEGGHVEGVLRHLIDAKVRMPEEIRILAASRSRARMAELVDAPASGAGARKGVEVRAIFWISYRGEEARRKPGEIPYSSLHLTLCTTRMNRGMRSLAPNSLIFSASAGNLETVWRSGREASLWYKQRVLRGFLRAPVALPHTIPHTARGIE
jgi:hypothetical protein